MIPNQIRKLMNGLQLTHAVLVNRNMLKTDNTDVLEILQKDINHIKELFSLQEKEKTILKMELEDFRVGLNSTYRMLKDKTDKATLSVDLLVINHIINSL